MAHNSQLSAIAKWSIDEFAKGFGLAIEGMAGAPPDVAFELLDAAPAPAVPLFGWTQPLNGVRGEAFVMAPEPDVLALGQHVMAAAGVEDALLGLQPCLEGMRTRHIGHRELLVGVVLHLGVVEVGVPVDLDGSRDVADVVEQHVLVRFDDRQTGRAQMFGQPVAGDQPFGMGVVLQCWVGIRG